MDSTFPRGALATEAIALSKLRPTPSAGTRRSTPLYDIDRATLQLAIRGDRQALGEVIAHYERPVFAFLSRSLGQNHRVQDLAQEVFLRVLCALPHFELREAKLSTWIFQIAVRLLQDESRRRRLPASTDSLELASSAPDPEQQSATNEQLTILERAAQRLPEEQRIALVLMEFHGLDHREISRVIGCSPLTVKTRIFRARRFLEKALACEPTTPQEPRP